MKNKKTWKLSSLQKDIVYRLYAEFTSFPKILEELKKQWSDIDVSVDALCSIVKSKKAKAIIQKYRQELSNDLSDLPYANKRYRIMRLSFIAQKTEDTNPSIALRAIEQIRIEIENTNLKDNFNKDSDIVVVTYPKGYKSE